MYTFFNITFWLPKKNFTTGNSGSGNPREFDRDVYPQGGDFDRTFDLPQVDLMNTRVEYVRAAEQGTKSQSGHFEGRETAERATKSRVVDLSRLKGFHLLFAPNMRSGVTCNWCCIGFTPTKTIKRVCVSPASKDQIWLLCAEVITYKDFK